MLLAPCTRRARAAALSLALAAPIVAATAAPAFASGESTSAVLTSPTTGSASTFTWSYTFHQGAGHGLSNVAIGFCSADILADVVSAGPSGEVFKTGNVPGGHTGFGAGVKFGVTATTGTLTVTFAHPHAISAGGLRVQSHSGDGQTGDTITTASGPGPCPGDETPTTTSSTTTTTTTTTTTVTTSSDHDDTPTTTTTTTSGGDDPTTTTTAGVGDPDAISDPLPTTTTTTEAPATVVGETTTTTGPTAVLGETVEKGADPAPAATPAADPGVLGNLAHTGAAHLILLVRAGLAMLVAGVGLLALRRRRMRLQ